MDSQSHDEDWVQPFFIAHHESQRDEPVTADLIDQANFCNYDMLTTPITNAHFQSRVIGLISAYRERSPQDSNLPCPTIPTLSLLDTYLSPSNFTQQLLGFTSSWIDICNPDPLICGLSRQVLALEIAYAGFCGLDHVFIPGPRLYHEDVATHGILRFARSVQEALNIGSHMHISVVVPMIDQADLVQEVPEGDLSSYAAPCYFDEAEELRSKNMDAYGTWDAWNLIRSTCKYTTRLSVAVTVPNFPTDPEIQSRWYSEPVKAILIPKDAFVLSGQGTILPTRSRTFVSRLMRMRMSPWIILQDVEPIPHPSETEIADNGRRVWKDLGRTTNPTPAEAKTSSKPKESYPFTHLEHIRSLQRRQPPRSDIEKYGSGYQDYLQIPLQPLTDNLESVTYEVFEKDPVKYSLYEEAIAKALRDWKDQKKSTSGSNGRVVVAVAGAGRGPLVTRALKASKAEGVEIEMWAVEKNPNAFVLLQRHNLHSWDGQVAVEQSDMRSWQGPWHIVPQTASSAPENDGSPPVSVPAKENHHIDILISELLGSFADNELSPECLDGILHLLSPQGISIPHSYTAYLTPISAPKLHTDLISRLTWDPVAMETPAVVWLHAIDYLSINKDAPPPTTSFLPTTPVPSTTPKVLPAWSFEHVPLKVQMPFPVSNTHNERFSRTVFRIRNRGVCHGLGGYFESVLYPGVELSTNPLTMEAKSKEMISWFPIFFPLKTPLYVPDCSEIAVTMWRQTDNRKVWYEWMIEAFAYNSALQGERDGIDETQKTGSRVRLGSSELHSSLKNGCLM